jgi:hypothetical protein
MFNETKEKAVERFTVRCELPEAKATRPATVVESNAVVGMERTWIVRTARHPEEGFGIFVQLADKSGITQLVLPDRVAQAIYRQRESLTDRSTPESRAKKRAAAEAAKRKKEKAERSRRWREKNPGRIPGQKKGD